MPPIRYYTVSQVREVNVRASGPIDAAIIATAKFDGHPKPGQIEGSTTTEIRIRELDVKENS